MKTILITGATSGVGKATAFALAKPKNHLILIARNAQKGKQVKQEILNRYPNACIELLMADLSLISDMYNLVKAFQASHEKLDVLIN